jgi:hypothetical protein
VLPTAAPRRTNTYSVMASMSAAPSCDTNASKEALLFSNAAIATFFQISNLRDHGLFGLSSNAFTGLNFRIFEPIDFRRPFWLFNDFSDLGNV